MRRQGVDRGECFQKNQPLTKVRGRLFFDKYFISLHFVNHGINVHAGPN